MSRDCANITTPCDGDWDDDKSLCDACRTDRESALIDAAMDALQMRDTSEFAEGDRVLLWFDMTDSEEEAV